MDRTKFKGTGTRMLVERATELAQDEDARTIRFIASDETVDRYGDVVSVDGWELSNYRDNPVFLWGHNYDRPIGKVIEIGVEKNRLMATARLAAKGVSDFIDGLWALIGEKIVNAVSVGFSVNSDKDYEPILDDDEKPTGGLRFLRQELLEISLVAVPANPSALLVARGMNLPPHFLKQVLLIDASVTEQQHEFRAREARLRLAGLLSNAPR